MQFNWRNRKHCCLEFWWSVNSQFIVLKMRVGHMRKMGIGHVLPLNGNKNGFEKSYVNFHWLRNFSGKCFIKYYFLFYSKYIVSHIKKRHIILLWECMPFICQKLTFKIWLYKVYRDLWTQVTLSFLMLFLDTLFFLTAVS